MQACIQWLTHWEELKEENRSSIFFERGRIKEILYVITSGKSQSHFCFR